MYNFFNPLYESGTIDLKYLNQLTIYNKNPTLSLLCKKNI